MVYTTAEIAKRVRPVAERYRLNAVFLFGSYARETAAEESDIDLLVAHSYGSVSREMIWKTARTCRR